MYIILKIYMYEYYTAHECSWNIIATHILNEIYWTSSTRLCGREPVMILSLAWSFVLFFIFFLFISDLSVSVQRKGMCMIGPHAKRPHQIKVNALTSSLLTLSDCEYVHEWVVLLWQWNLAGTFVQSDMTNITLFENVPNK